MSYKSKCYQISWTHMKVQKETPCTLPILKWGDNWVQHVSYEYKKWGWQKAESHQCYHKRSQESRGVGHKVLSPLTESIKVMLTCLQ